MSKKLMKEVVDMNELQNMADEANASAAEEKANKDKKEKANKDKKEKANKDKKEKEAPKVDAIKLASIMTKVPETFTPAVLDKAFGLNDGGKTVRRHLRNHFADKMAHNKKDKWVFDKSTSTDIIEYFAARYTFNEVK